MRLFRPLTNIQNAAASSKMQIICPVRGTYDRIQIAYAGTAVTRAMLTNIKVIADGETIQEFADGDELDQYNDYYGRPDTAGYLTLYGNRPEMEGLADKRIFGWGTADLQTFVIESDIGASAPGDFAVTAQAQVSEQQPLGVFTRIKRIAFNSAVSGEVDVPNIPLNGRIIALHAKKSNVSRLRVLLDEVEIWDSLKTPSEVYLAGYDRAPVTAAYTHADWCLEGDTAQAIITEVLEGGNRKKRDLLVKPTLDSSGACPFIVEYLDTLTKKAA